MATYLDEIHEQPAIFERLSAGLDAPSRARLGTLRSCIAKGEIPRLIITGMGGSLHGAYPFHVAMARSLSIPVIYEDASELLQQMLPVVGSDAALVAISQSGESGELVELARQLDARNQRPSIVVSVTNMGDSSLSRWADVALRSNAGEEATVSSKSYTGGLACLHLLAAELAGGADAAQSAAAAVAATGRAIAVLLAGWQQRLAPVMQHINPHAPLVYVGRGPSLGSARTASLLTQEASKLSCTTLSGGQFRHGPIELVREGFQAVFFLGDDATRSIDEALIQRITSLNGRVVAVVPEGVALKEHPNLVLFSYPDVDTAMRPVMEALFIQLLQTPLAQARGFRAGQFFNATKITGIY